MLGIGIRLLIVAAVLAALAFAVHKYNEHFRDQGRAEVQVVFDAYKVAQDKQRQEIIANYLVQLDGVRKEKSDADKVVAAVFAEVNRDVGAVRSTVGGVRLPADLRGVLDASSAAANGRLAPADGRGQARPEAVPASTEAATYDEREFAQFLSDGAAAYDDAVGLWQSCRKREDACRDAKAKGNVP
jgi:hypothetical protein